MASLFEDLDQGLKEAIDYANGTGAACTTVLRYNAETEAAMQEARDIMSGKIQTKSYSSAKEILKELDEECQAKETQ